FGCLSGCQYLYCGLRVQDDFPVSPDQDGPSGGTEHLNAHSNCQWAAYLPGNERAAGSPAAIFYPGGPWVEISRPGTFHQWRCLREGSQEGMIELFKQPNLDWMGKAKYFYALSGILLLAGWISIFFGRGIKYGIDFSGGTNVDVRFAQPPSIDKIRAGLTAQGIGTSEIQPIRDISAKSSNEVLIFVEGKGQDEDLMQSSRDKVLNALSATYGVATSDKPD